MAFCLTIFPTHHPFGSSGQPSDIVLLYPYFRGNSRLGDLDLFKVTLLKKVAEPVLDSGSSDADPVLSLQDNHSFKTKHLEIQALMPKKDLRIN